jgi:hypothetical protein
VAIGYDMTHKHFEPYRRHLERDDKLQEILDEGSLKLATRPLPDWIDIMVKLKCNPGRDLKTISRIMPKAMSGVMRTDLEALVGKLPLEWWVKAVIIIPYCDVYDRPVTLVLFDRDLGKLEIPLASLRRPDDEEDGESHKESGGEGGLAYLNEVPCGTESVSVYAVSDPALAAQLRCQGLQTRLKGDLPPIVGWIPHRTTNASWQAITTYRHEIILWSPQINLDLFQQARQCDGCVAMAPLYQGKHQDIASVSGYLRSLGTKGWLKEASASAVNWRNALVQWLADAQQVEEAMDLVVGLNLTGPEIRSLYECIPRGDSAVRQRLQIIFGYLEPPITVEFDGHTVEQVNNQWVLRESGRKPKRILDGVLVLENLYRTSNGNIGVKGSFVRDKVSVPFHVPFEDIHPNAGKWLRGFMATQGQAMPQVCRGWDSALYGLAQQFNNPVVVAATDKIGYINVEKGFVFPNFSVVHGGVVTTRQTFDPALGDELPCGRLKHISLLQKEDLVPLSATPAHACGWGLLASMLSNLTCPLNINAMGDTRGIVLSLEDEDSVGYAIADGLAREMSLPRRILRPEDDPAVLEMGYGLPCVVNALQSSDEILRRYVANPVAKSNIVMVKSLAAWRELSLAGCHLVDGRERVEDPMFPFFLGASVLFTALAKLQSENYPAEPIADAKAMMSYMLNSVTTRGRAKDGPDAIKYLLSALKGDTCYMTRPSHRVMLPILFLVSVQPSMLVEMPDGSPMTMDSKRPPPGSKISVKVKNVNHWLMRRMLRSLSLPEVSGAAIREGALLNENNSGVFLESNFLFDVKDIYCKLKVR